MGMAAFSMNIVLMAWMVWKFILETVYEYKNDPARDKAAPPSKMSECLTKCVKKVGKRCPCLIDATELRRKINERTSNFFHAAPAPPAAKEVELQEGSNVLIDGNWERHLDEASGKWYRHNSVLKVTEWEQVSEEASDTWYRRNAETGNAEA